MTASPQAAPFQVAGSGPRGRTGILLQHGFTGSPFSMRPWAEHLAEQGYTVSVPLLPGHGTSWRDLNRHTWADWYAAMTTAFDELSERVDRVFVCGLSMGGGLALRLAADRPDEVAGLVLVNPAVHIARWETTLLPVVKHLMPGLRGGLGNDVKKDQAVQEEGYERTPLKAADSMFRGYRRVRRDLGRVRSPLLMFRSVVDHVVDPSSGRIILHRIASTEVEERLLHDSFHVATLDHDAPQIFSESADFIARLSGDHGAPRPVHRGTAPDRVDAG